MHCRHRVPNAAFIKATIFPALFGKITGFPLLTVLVTLLSIIAASILLGTVVDLYDNKPTDHQIIKAFSLAENLKFVFSAPPPGGSSRFGCLEGMRSLSMTW